MSEYFDSTTNRVIAGSLAQSSQVNNLRDEVGTGFDRLPASENLKDGNLTFGIDTGSVNAYAVALPNTRTSYSSGMTLSFNPANTNTGASTLDVDVIGPISIKRPDGTDVQAGDLLVGQIVTLTYNGTHFVFTGAIPNSFYAEADTARDEAISARDTTVAKEALVNPHYTAIDTVSTNIAKVDTVATNLDKGAASEIDIVASNMTDVNTVAGIDSDVTTVAGINANVTTVAGNSANVTKVANIDTNVTTVANNDANVTTVAGISGNVTTVAGINANVTTVAGSIANVNTVAADLNESISEIDTVATDITNVNTVGTAIANVNTTATNIANVNTVAGISGNVTTVAGISADVTTVASNETEIDTVVTNITAIQNASANAASAAASLASFQDIYHGESAIAPTVNVDIGDLYLNTTDSSMYVCLSTGPDTWGKVNIYSHPVHPGDDINIDTLPLTGATVISDLDLNVTTDTEGHVTDANGVVSTRTLTLGDIGAEPADAAIAKTDVANTWTASQNFTQVKIDSGTDTGANGILLDNNQISFHNAENNTCTMNYIDSGDTLEISVGNIAVVGTVDGRNISADGSKLDGIATSANNYTHPSYTARNESCDTGPLSGATVISDLDFNIQTDISGHMTACDITTVSTRDLTLADLGAAAASHTHTGATISSLDASDTTTGIFDTARIPTGISITGSSASCTGNAATATTAAACSGNAATATTAAACSGNAATATTATGLQATAPCKITSNGAVLDFGSLNASYCHFNTTATSGFYFYDSIYSLGNVTAYSDRRQKTNLEVIPNALDKVSKISGYTFDRTDRKTDRQTGLIAQELKEVLPEAVVEDPETGYYSIAYGNVVGLLTEAIKELKAEVEELKKPWWKKLREKIFA